METDIAPETPEAFIAAIESATFTSSPCIPIAHKFTILDRMLSFIQRGDFYGLYRIVVKRLTKKKL